ncbi:unnamed protein product, partial [Closterium sp. NIES-53]
SNSLPREDRGRRREGEGVCGAVWHGARLYATDSLSGTRRLPPQLVPHSAARHGAMGAG